MSSDDLPQVREKLHLVLAMSTFSPNFHSSLRNFPCILNCCTVDWFTLWPPDALHFVSRSFLKDIQFSQAELEGCTKVSEFFHTSATELADQAYDTEILFNCVTPATFLELNSLFKTLLQALIPVKTLFLVDVTSQDSHSGPDTNQDPYGRFKKLKV